MALKLITPPAGLPVTVAEAKADMNIEHNDDDAIIAGFIATAVETAQLITGRQLVEAVYELILAQFPPPYCWGPCRQEHFSAIELPGPPLIAVASITYVDTEGVLQTLSEDRYTVDVDNIVGRVLPAFGTSWPAVRVYPGSVRVRFSCGWPMSDETSPPVWTGPESFRTWIMKRVATLYENREAIITGQAASELPRSHVDGLLDGQRVFKVV